MPIRTTKLLGIDLAASVSITAIQAAVTVNLGPIAWGVDPNAGGGGGSSPAAPGPGSPTINITIAEQTGALFAPCAVKLRFSFTGANLTKPVSQNDYDPTFKGLHYCTSWGDPGQFRNARVMHSSHRDRNISYAPDPAHTYSAPGTYTANVYIFDDAGNWGTAQRTYTIVAPDDFFTLSETIVAAFDANFALAPAVPAENQVSTSSALATRIAALLNSGSGRCRVRYKAGVQFDITNTIEPDNGILLEDSYGGGRGLVRYASPFSFQGRRNVSVFTNMRVVSAWNQITEFGEQRRRWVNRGRTGNVTLTHDCDYDDWSLVHYTTEPLGEGISDFVFSDCEFRGGKTFTALSGSAEAASRISGSFLGCAFIQIPGASNGWVEEHHGPVRYTHNDSGALRGSGDLVMEGCAYYNKANWAFGGTLLNGNKFDGACLRWGNGATAGDRVFLGRSYFEGGVDSEQPGGGNFGWNWLADKCTFVNTPASVGQVSELQKGGSWWQNCLFILPDHIRTGSSTSPIDRLIRAAQFGGSGAPGASRPTGARQNTVVDLRSPSRSPGSTSLLVSQDLTNVVQVNNVTYAPNRTVPVVPAGGVTPTGAGIQALYDGVRLSWEGVVFTLTGAVANNATVDLPYPNDRFGAATTEASYAGTNNQHCVAVGGGKYIPGPNIDGAGVTGNAISVAFIAGGIRVTNLSGTTWASGAQLRMRVDRGSTLMALDTTSAQPAGSLVLPYLNAAVTVGAGDETFDDFICRLRPGTGRANAPAGTASQGALEPA